MLPKPYIKKEGTRVVKAFKTSYRRMKWDKCSNALTTNSGVISSMQGHPEQNRVLSFFEIMIIASIYPYPTLISNGNII